jgi:hypothetical protein
MKQKEGWSREMAFDSMEKIGRNGGFERFEHG